MQAAQFGTPARDESSAQNEASAQQETKHAESSRAVDGASTSSVEEFIRDKYATSTAKDFPSADKKKFASMEGGD